MIELIQPKELILLKVKSKESMIFHYWFCNYGFKFQDSICNDCHNFTMLSGNISDIATITVKNVDYCCIINKYANMKQLIY